MLHTRRLRLIFCIIPLCLFGFNSIFAQAADTTLNDQVDSIRPSVVVGEVIVTGFKQTKPYIIERELAFRKGDIIPGAELDKRLELSRQQVMNTTLFNEVSVKVINQIGDVVYIDVHVKERWYLFPLPIFELIDRNFNTWWVDHKRSLKRINYGLTFSHNNLTGRNDKLKLSFISGYTQKASLRYENPFIEKSLKHGINMGFSYSRNREIYYATDSSKQSFIRNDDDFLFQTMQVDMAYSYRPAVKTRHNFRVSYNDLRINDFVHSLNPDFFANNARRIKFPDFTYNIQYFNVDYIPYALRGFSGDAQFYKRFGKENNMVRITGKGTYTNKVLPKTYLQFQASGLIRFPYEQPFYNLRMFGSSSLYMRGLEYYVIDGVAGGMVRGTAIREILNVKFSNPINVKTLDKIPLRVFFKTYTDVGYAYHPKPGSSILNNKLLRTWGIGLDVVTFYDIVFKLEYSFNQLGEKGLFIHSRSDF